MAALQPRRHDAASHTRYQDLKQLARSQRRILAGTPGTLKQRVLGGRRYWVREHLRPDGRKDDEYLGAVPAERVTEAREEIELARALAAGSSTLRIFGFQRVDRKVAAVLAVLFNHKLFRAGLTLVGSHAYGALLNELGLIAPAYRTQDIDVARAQRLQLAGTAPPRLSELLAESGLEFVPVPGLPVQRPSASYKLRGAEGLGVDLLAPGTPAGRVVAVEELSAHAQTVPLLDFLIDERLEAIVLSPNQVIPVAVPAPERFALHKLYSSQSRSTDRDKVRKDLQQAAVLSAVLEEDAPGRLYELYRALPAMARPAVRRGASAAAALLPESPARESLERIAGR